jgi:DNA replication protein DnaC
MSGAAGEAGRRRLRSTLPDLDAAADGGEAEVVPMPVGPRPGEAPSARSAPERAACALGVCDGSGWIVEEDGETARPCDCRRRRIERARASGVSATLPKRFRGVSFDRPPVTEMLARPGTRAVVSDVREFCERIGERLDAGSGLWLEGDPGTGKTTLAMLVAKAALDAGRTAAIYSLPGLLARIRRTFDGESGEDSYFTFFNRLVSVDLLHLDDLGAESRSEWVLEQLYAIVDRRYSDQRSIVVTTNLPLGELEQQIGARTVSRLVEICGEAINVPGADHRFQLNPGGLGGGAA